MPGWQGSDQGVCWNRPSALDSLGDLEATAVPRAVVGPNWLVIRSQKFPYERESNALRLPNTTGAEETRQER
jgi:hypothetical protein